MTDQQLTSVWVVIPAAGIGQRMNSLLPKQYLKIQGKSLIEHTFDCFLEHKKVAGIVVALSVDDEHWQALDLASKSKPIYTVQGGSNRSDSVMQGLSYLNEELKLPEKTWVMVHDAARPCLTTIDIDSLLQIRNDDCVGGILASPVRDTMKRAVIENNTQDESEVVSHTESRENLWHALTPQMFRMGDLIKALKHCHNQNVKITDECSAMEKMGLNPKLVEGSHNNIKVTYASDIEMASFLIRQKQRDD